MYVSSYCTRIIKSFSKVLSSSIISIFIQVFFFFLHLFLFLHVSRYIYHVQLRQFRGRILEYSKSAKSRSTVIPFLPFFLSLSTLFLSVKIYSTIKDKIQKDIQFLKIFELSSISDTSLKRKKRSSSLHTYWQCYYIRILINRHH